MNAPAMDKVIEQYRITEEPYYRAIGDEVQTFDAAYAVRMPMMLKGPTGCGKTRFVEYMAWKLGKPLITLACNEDMTASDLAGRYLLDNVAPGSLDLSFTGDGFETAKKSVQLSTESAVFNITLGLTASADTGP